MSEELARLREVVGDGLAAVKVVASAVRCPACGGRMTEGPIRCPDRRADCREVHVGLRCGGCGKHWVGRG